ncbi:MAG: sulfite exporter TauE/SafE family protein [Schleiferiaceae bacterium]|jgi:uncharacterized membrane protein YfcA|nr:sulfite exporter TauE/SafE family protein [Schleiferiaceae bacterium]
MDGLDIVLLILGGFMAGVINTVAGNGSAITLTVLMATGLDANVANATNRIGVLSQTLTAVLSIKKTKRARKLAKDSVWFFWPTILGSIIGALLAVDIDEQKLKVVIGFFMVVLLITLLLRPKRWLINTDASKKKKTPLNFLIFLAIGVYGGFIQMGIGIMILSSLVLLAHYSLRDANIIKLWVAFIMILPAFIIFLLSGDIVWVPGLILATGAAIGARLGARYVLSHPKANTIIRYVLIAILIVAIVRIFYPMFAN